MELGVSKWYIVYYEVESFDDIFRQVTLLSWYE